MTRGRKIGVAAGNLWPGLFFAAAISNFCSTTPFAGEDPASAGVVCQVGAPFWAPPAYTAEDLPWASVWLGHFSGGRRFEDGNETPFIDWRDDKFCFPSRQRCQAWIAGLRRAYRHPEGYSTCLLLR